MSKYTIHTGDCLEVMPTLPADSVDTIITDPPYALTNRVVDGARCHACGWIGTGDNRFYKGDCPECGAPVYRERMYRGSGFMGKDWDTGLVAFSPEVWAEALRVAKPGAFLLAFGGTRTFHRLACAIEDAGWEIRDTVMWVYGSGFPKSHDISKAIDKAAGAERDVVGPNPNGRPNMVGVTAAVLSPRVDAPITAPATPAAETWDGWGTALKPAWEPIIVAMKPLSGTFAANALEHGVAGLWIDGGRVGTEPGELTPRNNKIGQNGWKNSSGGYIEPSPLGRWPANLIHDGSDEVLAGFPETGAARAADRGKGIDGPTFKNVNGSLFGVRGHNDNGGSAARFFYCAKASRSERNAGLAGAEIVMIQLTHDSEATTKDGESWVKEGQNLRLLVDTEQSAVRVIGASCTMEDTEWSTWLFGSNTTAPSLTASKFTIETVTNSTTESRILSYLMQQLTNGSTAVANYAMANGGSPAESAGNSNQWQLSITNESPVYLPGVGNVASKTQWRISGSANSAREGGVGQLTNFHSTVKPIALMRYLARLTRTPTGGVVLDPFCGSGSTGIGAVLEGRDFIGIEQDAEYAEIADRRIAHWRAEAEPEQLQLV